MTVEDQARAFAGMVLCGICIGMAYDLLGILRRGKLSAAAADLLLGILGAMGIIAAGLLLGCDPFRIYALLGAALGWAIYGASLGTFVRIFAEKVHIIVKKSEKSGKKQQIHAGE